MTYLLLFFALKNSLVLLEKRDSGELCCPAAALISQAIQVGAAKAHNKKSHQGIQKNLAFSNVVGTYGGERLSTVKVLNIQTPENFG